MVSIEVAKVLDESGQGEVTIATEGITADVFRSVGQCAPHCFFSCAMNTATIPATSMKDIHPTAASKFQNPPNESHINDVGQWCEKTALATYHIHVKLHGKHNSRFEQGERLIFKQCDQVLDMLKGLGAYAVEYSRVAFNLVTHSHSENVQYLRGTLVMAKGLSRTMANLCRIQQKGTKLLLRVAVPEEMSGCLREAKIAFERVGNALKFLSEYFKQHLSHLKSLLSEGDFGNGLESFEDAVVRVHESWWGCRRNCETAMSRVSQAADLIAIPRGKASSKGASKSIGLLRQDGRIRRVVEVGLKRLGPAQLGEPVSRKRPSLLGMIMPCLKLKHRNG